MCIHCAHSLDNDILIEGLMSEVGGELWLLQSLMSCHFPPYFLTPCCTGDPQLLDDTKLPLLTNRLHMLCHHMAILFYPVSPLFPFTSKFCLLITSQVQNHIFNNTSPYFQSNSRSFVIALTILIFFRALISIIANFNQCKRGLDSVGFKQIAPSFFSVCIFYLFILYFLFFF